MILRATALSVLLAASTPLAQPRPTQDALDGVDTVVLLTQGKEVFGKEAFKTTSYEKAESVAAGGAHHITGNLQRRSEGNENA